MSNYAPVKMMEYSNEQLKQIGRLEQIESHYYVSRLSN